MTRVLVNWLYHPAVGHALEAFKYARGLLEVDPGLDVHLLLPSSPACGLPVAGVTVHAIDLANPEALRALPAEWDYLISDPRLPRLMPGEDVLIRSWGVAQSHFRAKVDAGVAPVLEEWFGTRDRVVLGHRANTTVRFDPSPVPRVQSRLGPGLNVCVLPAGTTAAQAPSVSTWVRLCAGLAEAWPDISVHFTGVSRRRSTTTSRSRRDVTRIARFLPSATVWWNRPFEEQLALIAACDLFIAPHSGFAFFASAVGTPWLALSCCSWPEYLFNGTPVAAVLPRCGSYPSVGDYDTACVRRVQATGESECFADLADRAAEVVAAARYLLDPATTYADAMARHLAAVTAHPHSDRFFFYDGRDSLQAPVVRDAG